jgi:hypothetical protein
MKKPYVLHAAASLKTPKDTVIVLIVTQQKSNYNNVKDAQKQVTGVN